MGLNNHVYGQTAHLNVKHEKPLISNTFKSAIELGPEGYNFFEKRSKSVSRNPQIDIKQSLISNSERIINQNRIQSTQIQLGDKNNQTFDGINSEAKLSYGNNYRAARDFNAYDDTYVKFIKQHNWEYSDASRLEPKETPR